MTSASQVLADLHQYTSYMVSMFTSELARNTNAVAGLPRAPPSELTPQDIAECAQVVRTLASAFLNPGMMVISLLDLSNMYTVSVDWDVDRYHVECIRRHISDGMQTKELHIERDFPMVSVEVRSVYSPMTVTDKFGRILLWALPDILPTRIQV